MTGRCSDKQEKRRRVTSHDASAQLAQESIGSNESAQYLKGSIKGSTVLEPAVVHEVDLDHGRKTMIQGMDQTLLLGAEARQSLTSSDY